MTEDGSRTNPNFVSYLRLEYVIISSAGDPNSEEKLEGALEGSLVSYRLWKGYLKAVWPDFCRTLIGETPKSALRSAEGRPEG